MFGGGVQARRCSMCGISYPPEYAICAICQGTDLWAMYKTGPDDDWQERVSASLGEAVYLQPKQAYGFAHPRENISVPVSFHDDRLWIRNADLVESGYTSLEAGSIVWVNDSFYELQSRSHVSRKWDYWWWVEEIVTEGAADDLHPAMLDKWRPDEDD